MCPLARQVCKEAGAGKNVFLSPFSLSTALAMVHAGARGNTAAEMGATLRFSGVPDGVSRAVPGRGRVRARGREGCGPGEERGAGPGQGGVRARGGKGCGPGVGRGAPPERRWVRPRGGDGCGPGVERGAGPGFLWLCGLLTGELSVVKHAPRLESCGPNPTQLCWILPAWSLL